MARCAGPAPSRLAAVCGGRILRFLHVGRTSSDISIANERRGSALGWDQQASEERKHLQALTAEAEMAYLSRNELVYVRKLRSIAQALKRGDSSLRMHIHSRLRNIRRESAPPMGTARAARTSAPRFWAGPPVTNFGKRSDAKSKAVRLIGPPLWSARNRVRYPATDGVTPYWWSCPKGEERHPDWQQTLWQYERGKTCPCCLAESSGVNSWMPQEVRWGALIRHDDAFALTFDSSSPPGAINLEGLQEELGHARRSRIGTFIDTQKYEVFGDDEVVCALQEGSTLGRSVPIARNPRAPGAGAHPAESRARFVQERNYPGLNAGSFRSVAGQETIGPDAVWWRVLLECEHVFEQARNACFHSAHAAFGPSSLCLTCDDEQRIAAAVPLFGVLGD